MVQEPAVSAVNVPAVPEKRMQRRNPFDEPDLCGAAPSELEPCQEKGRRAEA